MLRAATRGSPLARLQTDLVGDLLAAATGEGVESVIVDTVGDRRQDVPIWEMGGQGVFVKEVQHVLLDGGADIAVHSAKDLPSTTAAGLVIGAVPRREDPRDVLVGSTLDALPVGARVGTGSVRRRSQLAALRPDLTFGELRGNIGTRLAKAGQFGAIVMAAAALRRLGQESAIAEVLDPELVLPQVAQGALAIECRADDTETLERLAAIEHPPSRLAVDAERAFLASLGGGCDIPAGAHATVDDSGTITMTAMLASPDGRMVLRAEDTDTDASALGRRLASYLLEDSGGARLLEDLHA